MKKFFIQLHRILGTALSLAFLMWFLSGMVMIYSGFPHVNRKNTFNNLENVSKYSNKITMPADTLPLSLLTLEIVNHTPVYSIGKHCVHANSFQKINKVSEHVLDSVIQSRYKSSVKRKEILTDFDAWIPWSSFKAYFPIHKYYLNDSASTEVYVAGTTGKIVQETTAKKRWLARFGAIPHWFYFKSLRLHNELWADFVIWLSGIGAIMCLTGLIVGIYRSRKIRKLKNKGLFGFSPYKKKWFRWHHITGMIFGLFTFTFVLSGFFSMTDVPKWLIPVNKTPNYNQLWQGKKLDINSFKLPLSKILADERFNDVKQIQFSQINGIPYYLLYKEYRKPLFINAANADTIHPKLFNYEDMVVMAQKALGKFNYKIEQLEEFDNYYFPRNNVVAKITIEDKNNTALYVKASNPTYVQYMNTNRRVGRWIYISFHSFSFPVLHKIDWLRKTLLIVVSIFGIIISFTGVVLSVNYLRRLFRRRKK